MLRFLGRVLVCALLLSAPWARPQRCVADTAPRLEPAPGSCCGTAACCCANPGLNRCPSAPGAPSSPTGEKAPAVLAHRAHSTPRSSAPVALAPGLVAHVAVSLYGPSALRTAWLPSSNPFAFKPPERLLALLHTLLL